MVMTIQDKALYINPFQFAYTFAPSTFSRRSAVLLFYKSSEAGHQGIFEDGHHKIQKPIFMITIESLVEQGANVKLEVTPTDLKMFAESIVQRTIAARQEELDAEMQRAAEETWLNTKQVRELRRHAQPLGEARLPRPCQGRQQEHVCQVRHTPHTDGREIRECDILLQEEKWLT